MTRLTDQIKTQTQIYLKNICQCLNHSTQDQWNVKKSRWPLWKHFHHLLQSADKWFINPYNYKPSSEVSHFSTEKIISKEEMLSYYKTIETKIDRYLNELNVEKLCEYPEGSHFSRLELIMAQMRHAMYHLGYIQHLLGRDEESFIYHGLDM